MTNVKHGTYYAYKRKGCRCADCTQANTEANQKWRANRAARGDKYVDKRKVPAPRRPCDSCGESTRSRGVRPICKACSCHQRRSVNVSRSVRLKIYERDGWTCGFCLESVDPSAPHNSPWQAVLDHIVPRSLGGADEESNLRLLHRYCNGVRSDDVRLTLAEMSGGMG